MTTQTQAKGKKKNKESTKISLDEFNQIDAPHGHSVVSVKGTGLDWAETMARDYDQRASETQQIIVPTAPKAQRGPGIDIDSLPSEPPFRCSLFNLPMSIEEKEICERFFKDIEVIRVDIQKSFTTVEVATQNDLYNALCKDGISIKNRTVNVCLYGQSPQNSYPDRYGSRGGSSYGDRYGDRGTGYGDRHNDRYNDRSTGYGDRYNDRSSGYGNRYNDRPSGFGERNIERSSGFDRFSDRQTGYDRFSDRTTGYGDRTGDRPGFGDRFGDRPTSYGGSRSNDRFGDRTSGFSRDREITRSGPPSGNEERPKLVLSKRKTPINVDDVSSVNRNEAIFGKAKPSSTPYQKLIEVEEKLSAVQISDRKGSPYGDSQVGSQVSSQAGSQPGSAPRSRRVSGCSRE